MAQGETGKPPAAARPAQAADGVPSTRLYVGNLPFDNGAEQIRAVFQPFGAIEDIDMSLDPATNKSRGYAFVQCVLRHE